MTPRPPSRHPSDDALPGPRDEDGAHSPEPAPRKRAARRSSSERAVSHSSASLSRSPSSVASIMASSRS
ncbi:hypothetical protein, partial [Streptomyces sp. NPDC048845]|uniref:hypothetical protein n=1 Tax=Streptomyces sp. NPDC048845 TaxID=3155390 RepID=UPI00343CA4C0